MTAQSHFVPDENIGNAAWEKLAQAANDVNHPMRLITLANTNAVNQPTARIMVIRGADRALGCIWMHTDRRSSKVGELRHRSHVCAVAYDPTDRVQLRLYGTATLHEQNSIASDHWQQIMLSMRHAYGLPTSPERPNQSVSSPPLNDPRLANLWPHQRSAELDEDRTNFAVIQIAVSKLEWLQVYGSEQHRALLCKTNDWA